MLSSHPFDWFSFVWHRIDIEMLCIYLPCLALPCFDHIALHCMCVFARLKSEYECVSFAKDLESERVRASSSHKANSQIK